MSSDKISFRLELLFMNFDVGEVIISDSINACPYYRLIPCFRSPISVSYGPFFCCKHYFFLVYILVKFVTFIALVSK